jgi:hypothetical protein
MWARVAASCFVFFVGTIVIAPLDELSAKPLPAMIIEPQTAAPFSEVSPAKNIFVLGSPPYPDMGFGRKWHPRPIDKRLCGLHLNFTAYFTCLRGKEKRCWRGDVDIVGWHMPGRASPIDAYCHRLGWGIAAVLPSWKDSEARKEQFWPASISLWQIIQIKIPGVNSGSYFNLYSVQKDEGSFHRFESILSGAPRVVQR